MSITWHPPHPGFAWRTFRGNVLGAAEARKQAITDLYCSPGFFERTGKEEVAALEAEQAALGPRIDALMAEWEALEQEIEAAQGE